MLYSVVVWNLLIIWSSFCGGKSYNNHIRFDEKFIKSLRNVANLDLPVDEEYEDLRAELLAYHTALATLSDTATRRSMKSTSCWKLGGVCINYKLCEGYRYITEVPGCKDKLTVCCLASNKFNVRDFSDYGLHNIAFPWRHPQKFGGKGILEKKEEEVKDKNVKGSNFKKKKLKGKGLSKVSSKVIVPEDNLERRKFKKKKLKEKKLTEVSSEVIGQQEPVKRSRNIIYDNVFPWNDSDDFEKKGVIVSEPKVLEMRKKSLIAKDMSDSDSENKSILHSLKLHLPFILVSLETE